MRSNFFLLDERLDLFLQNEYICWNNGTTGFFRFSSRIAWNAHCKSDVKQSLFRMQCIKPESTLMTWLGLPEVSEGHAAFPVGWLSPWVWAGQGQECPHWDSSSECWGGALGARPAPDCQLNLLERTSHLQNYPLIKLHCMCYTSRTFSLRTMKSWVISMSQVIPSSMPTKKRKWGVERCYTPVCLYACVCVIGPFWTQFNFHLFCFTYRGWDTAALPCTFFSALLTVTAFLCPLTSMMN